MPSDPYPRQRLSRVLGYQPIRISAGLKWAIWSSVLALPCAVTATGVSDSTAVFNAFRYVFSPGTMLAVRVIRVEASHRGLGSLIDVLDWYGKAMSFALLVNTVFYGLFIFGVITTISALTEKDAAHS